MSWRIPTVFAAALVASGCGSSEDTGAGSASAKASTAPVTTTAPATAAVTTAATTASAAPTKPLASNAVEIPALSVAIEPPPNVTGDAHEMGNGVAILDFKGYEVSLTVSPAHGDMAHTKKHRSADEGFQKWIEETDETAIGEVKVGEAKEYYGFYIKKMNDKHYECGTLTKRRRTSPNEKAVRASLALCKGLRLK